MAWEDFEFFHIKTPHPFCIIMFCAISFKSHSIILKIIQL